MRVLKSKYVNKQQLTGSECDGAALQSCFAAQRLTNARLGGFQQLTTTSCISEGGVMFLFSSF